MLLKEIASCDLVITTALIPGRPAPLLIKQHHVDAMPAGSVTVDLAAETGGNVATTVKDKSILTDNGVTCIGYTDLASRMGRVASELFSGNCTKLLMSMGPDGKYVVDHKDEAVRSMLVVHNGKKIPEYVPPPAPAPPPAAAAASKEEDGEVDLFPGTLNSALVVSGGIGLAHEGCEVELWVRFVADEHARLRLEQVPRQIS